MTETKWDRRADHCATQPLKIKELSARNSLIVALTFRITIDVDSDVKQATIFSQQ